MLTLTYWSWCRISRQHHLETEPRNTLGLRKSGLISSINPKIAFFTKFSCLEGTRTRVGINPPCGGVIDSEEALPRVSWWPSKNLVVAASWLFEMTQKVTPLKPHKTIQYYRILMIYTCIKLIFSKYDSSSESEIKF